MKTSLPACSIRTPDQLQWTDASKQFGEGAQAAFLIGDPTKIGPYVMRLRLPADAMVAAHTHPDSEMITVLKGKMGIGLGERADKSKGQQLPSGSFVNLPPNTPHFAWAVEDDTILEVHRMGPAKYNFLEPGLGSITSRQ